MRIGEKYAIGNNQTRQVHTTVKNSVRGQKQGVGDDFGLVGSHSVFNDRTTAGAKHKLVVILFKDLVVSLRCHRLDLTVYHQLSGHSERNYQRLHA